MTMRKGLPAKLANTDADDTRYDWLNDITTNADGSPRGGITSPIGTTLITGTAGMSVNIGRFAAIAPRDGGAIKLANDGTINLAVPNAPASGTRTHVIAARQDDASSTVTTPDADNVAKVYVIQDTGSGQPALPDGSVLLGTIAISAGQTSTNAATIAQATQYTAGAGAVVPFRTLAQLRLWTTAALNQVASVFADATNNGLYLYSATTLAWVPLIDARTTDVLSADTSLASGATMFTKVFAALPYATKIDLQLLGHVVDSPGGGADIRVVVTTTAGTLVTYDGLTNLVNGHYATIGAGGILSLPANTAATVTFVVNAAKQYAGMLTTRRYT